MAYDRRGIGLASKRLKRAVSEIRVVTKTDPILAADVAVSLMERLWPALQDLRKKKGLSQEELGFETGYHRTYISLLERGLRSPTLPTVFHLASALEVKPSEIIRRIKSSVYTRHKSLFP